MMKKLALLPALAMMLFAVSCSDSEEPRTIPNDPVISVPAVADAVTLNVPTQSPDYVYTPEINSSSYRFSYDNGQEIVCKINTQSLSYTFATVLKIEGTAADVVVPPSLRARMNNADGVEEVVDIPVIGLDLYENSVAETVTSITLPKTVCKMFSSAQNAYVNTDGTYLRVQAGKCPGLKKLELEEGYPGFVSVGGAVYTNDFLQLVCVPVAAEGIFTVAEGTEVIQPRALYKCAKIDGVTFPASVKALGSEALVGNDNLLVINMLPTEAPTAGADVFGYYADNCAFRIPAGCLAAYTFVKPDIEEPVEPAQPDPEASDELWDEYDAAMVQYRKDIKEYNEIMAEYDQHCGYSNLTNIQEVNF